MKIILSSIFLTIQQTVNTHGTRKTASLHYNFFTLKKFTSSTKCTGIHEWSFQLKLTWVHVDSTLEMCWKHNLTSKYILCIH